MCELARGLGLLKKQSHNAERYPLFAKEASLRLLSKEAALCRATAIAAARNDDKKAFFKKVDSSVKVDY